MANQNGYISNFEVYQGKGDKQVPDEFFTFGLGERVALQLTKNSIDEQAWKYILIITTLLYDWKKVKSWKDTSLWYNKKKKGMFFFTVDEELSRGDHDYRHSNLRCTTG